MLTFAALWCAQYVIGDAQIKNSGTGRLFSIYCPARHRRGATAMAELRMIVSEAGSHLAETSYFERDWQLASWGPTYPRPR